MFTRAFPFYEADIPLVVPEVNPHAVAGYTNRGIIANPNCSTIQMVVALKPIYDAVGIERVNVATYQAVSGTGKSAVDELMRQVAITMRGEAVELGPGRIAERVDRVGRAHTDARVDRSARGGGTAVGQVGRFDVVPGAVRKLTQVAAVGVDLVERQLVARSGVGGQHAHAQPDHADSSGPLGPVHTA